MAKKNETNENTTAKSLAKSALIAMNELLAFAEAEGMPEDLVKSIGRAQKKTESTFGKVIVWEELNS